MGSFLIGTGQLQKDTGQHNRLWKVCPVPWNPIKAVIVVWITVDPWSLGGGGRQVSVDSRRFPCFLRFFAAFVCFLLLLRLFVHTLLIHWESILQLSLFPAQDHIFLFLSYSVVTKDCVSSPTAYRAWSMGLSSFPELSGLIFYLRKGLLAVW